MTMAIAPGVEVVAAGGSHATVTGLTANQPTSGFPTADAAVQWQQAQLWYDHSFDRARPRAATAVVQATEGFQLLDLDRSLRVARGSENVPVSGWNPLDERVVTVVDGLGVRLPRAPRNAANDAATGAMLALRAGSPAHVALDGADARAWVVPPPGMLTPRNLALAGVGALAVAGIGVVVVKATG